MSERLRVVNRLTEFVAEPAQGLFTTPDGVEIYFEDSGGSGFPLFFVYGLACSIQHWKYPRAYLAKHSERRQIWMDFRGHGRSAAPRQQQRLTIDLIADDIAALCQKRQVEQAVILGQSMGGSIALALAARHPELARALILLASPGRDPAKFIMAQPFSRIAWRGLTAANRIAPGVLRTAHKGLAIWQRGIVGRHLLRELIRGGGFNHELARTDDIDEYIEEVLKVDSKLFFDLADDMSGFDVGQFGDRVRCPVLLIAGVRDKVVPPQETAYIASKLPEAELAMLAHGSHCPHFDDPGTVSRLIDEFLSRHGL